MAPDLPALPASVFAVHPRVAAAVAEGRPVVALESTIISHGLPRPRNLEVAGAIEQTVRDHGAVPATVGVLAGRVAVGLDDHELARLARGDGVTKLSVRDVAIAVATGHDGATTVASTSAIAARCGIGVFATGGLGGVHRGARDSWDESADLAGLARTPVTVVCSGVKSILDVAATLERLESLSVPVVGFGTDRFPGFYLRDSGQPLDWRLDTAEQVADVIHARAALGLGTAALVVANPVAADAQMDPALHDELLQDALAGLAADGITGNAVTPYLLDRFHRESGGVSLQVNIDIILRNAALAADIAVAASR